MTGQQIILLVINVIGGIAVIGSYIFGLSGQTGAANTLWGGLPTAVRPVYGISMILSALGYFAFIYFILFHVDPAEAAIAGRFGYALFYAIFLVILMPSALWMPLTKAYVAHPNDGLWIAIRAVLFLVGLASIALTWALFSLNTKAPPVAYWLAVAGSCYFALHTTILDAIAWAALFK
jgi:uncharacterized membrane protein